MGQVIRCIILSLMVGSRNNPSVRRSICGDLHRDDQLLHPADQNVLHNAELFTVAVSDASLVAQRAFIAAQALGLGGVIVGGVRNETAKMGTA